MATDRVEMIHRLFALNAERPGRRLKDPAQNRQKVLDHLLAGLAL